MSTTNVVDLLNGLMADSDREAFVRADDNVRRVIAEKPILEYVQGIAEQLRDPVVWETASRHIVLQFLNSRRPANEKRYLNALLLQRLALF